MKKKICASNVVRQMDEAVINYNANHRLEISPDSGVHVAMVMLTSSKNGNGRSADNRKAPFLCFMRKASRNKTVIVGLESGKAEIVNNRELVIKHKDMDTFSMHGVRYKLKDCVNGLPRFVVAYPHSYTKIENEEIYF